MLQYSQKNTCFRVFLKKDTSTQVFYWGYSEIFKNTYFEEYLRAAASLSIVLSEWQIIWQLPTIYVSESPWKN